MGRGSAGRQHVTVKPWISAETESKEYDFRGFMNMHAPATKGVMRRFSRSPYLYVDLYAGRGNLEFDGRHFPGSPLIAQDVLTRHAVPHEAIHFERDPGEAAQLAKALWVPVNLLDTPDAETAPIFTEACQDGFPKWLKRNGHQRDRYGLVFADPINDEIPHELLELTRRYLPKVDLLSYVAATQYKRRRGADPGKPFLMDHVNAVGKKVVLIRRPHAAWQFTFILWTDWEECPDWPGHGFYRLDSEDGRQVMDRLNLNAAEHHAKVNTPLWGGSDAALSATPAG